VRDVQELVQQPWAAITRCKTTERRARVFCA
jgi:hypothetical protein